jgi:dephospho-CoA kinase
MALVVGITGGIGTGKSTALSIFRSLGAATLSADDVAREVLSKGSPAYDEVVEKFGPGVVAANGAIDRAALGEIVFGDPEARKALNDITHPRIIHLLKERIDSFRQGALAGTSVLAVEIPLLVECGLEGLVDKVLLVAAEQATQVSRLTNISGLSTEQALRRIEAQMPLRDKVGKADYVIWNDGDLNGLEDSVRQIWDKCIALTQVDVL